MAVDEAHVAETDAIAVGDVHVGPRFDGSVVVAFHQRHVHAPVVQTFEQDLDFASFRSAGVADGVHQVTEKQHPVGVGAVEEREHCLAALLGATVERYSFGPKRTLDARVEVGDHQRALRWVAALGFERRDRGWLARNRFDETHQMGLRVSSPDS